MLVDLGRLSYPTRTMTDARAMPGPSLSSRLAAARRERGARTGRPPVSPATPDARLVAHVCAVLCCSRVELAHLLQYQDNGATLSRCNGARAVPLTEEARADLRALLEEARRGGEESDDD